MSSEPENNAPPADSGRRHHQSSPTDLFSSASLLAGAAQSSFKHDGAAIDKAKLAAAAEDLVDAAAKYGKLQERGYGSYVEKAEDYLHQIHTSSGKNPADHSPGAEKGAEGGERADLEEHGGHGEEKKKNSEEHHSDGGFGGFGGGGFGDYMKIAEGFLKK